MAEFQNDAVGINGAAVLYQIEAPTAKRFFDFPGSIPAFVKQTDGAALEPRCGEVK